MPQGHRALETEHKAKLPGELSFPLGAQDIAEALRDVPQFDHLRLSFRARPVFSATEFRTMLRARTPYVVFEVGFVKRAASAGTPRRLNEFWAKWYAKHWELTVFPVPRSSRHAAHRALVDVTLPDARRWLSRPDARHWESAFKARQYLFDAAAASVRILEVGDVLC